MPGTRRKTHWRPGSDSVRSPSEDVDPNAASLAVLEAAAAPSNQAEPAVWIPEKSLIRMSSPAQKEDRNGACDDCK